MAPDDLLYVYSGKSPTDPACTEMTDHRVSGTHVCLLMLSNQTHDDHSTGWPLAGDKGAKTKKPLAERHRETNKPR